MTEGLKRLAMVFGCVGALGYLVFMMVFTEGLTEIDHMLRIWATVLVITIVCFLVPFGLVHGIAWIIRGFRHRSGNSEHLSSNSFEEEWR